MCICEEKENIVLSKRKVLDIFETEIFVTTFLNFKTGDVYTKITNYSPNTTAFCLEDKDKYLQNFVYCPFCGRKLFKNNLDLEDKEKFINIFTIQDINKILKRQKTNFILPQNYNINYDLYDILYIQEEHIIDRENIIYKSDIKDFELLKNLKYRSAKELNKEYVRYKIKINFIKNIDIQDITTQDIENFGTDCDVYDIIPSIVLRQDFVLNWNNLKFVKNNSQYKYENNPCVTIYNFNLI